MGQERSREGINGTEIFEGVTIIRRHYHLMDVCGLDDDYEGERKNQLKALRAGLEVIRSVEDDGKNGKKRKDLQRTLQWLKGRDHETYQFVAGVLNQARAMRYAARNRAGMRRRF